MQLSSQSCPMEINDSFCKFGKINTSDALLDIFLCNLIVTLWEACTVVVFGRCAIGPFVIGCMLVRNFACSVLKKCLDAPESSFALKRMLFEEEILFVVMEATGESLHLFKIF